MLLFVMCWVKRLMVWCDGVFYCGVSDIWIFWVLYMLLDIFWNGWCWCVCCMWWCVLVMCVWCCMFWCVWWCGCCWCWWWWGWGWEWCVCVEGIVWCVGMVEEVWLWWLSVVWCVWWCLECVCDGEFLCVGWCWVEMRDESFEDVWWWWWGEWWWWTRARARRRTRGDREWMMECVMEWLGILCLSGWGDYCMCEIFLNLRCLSVWWWSVKNCARVWRRKIERARGRGWVLWYCWIILCMKFVWWVWFLIVCDCYCLVKMMMWVCWLLVTYSWNLECISSAGRWIGIKTSRCIWNCSMK